MTDTVLVKPNPSHPHAHALSHPYSGPLQGADGKVPPDGRHWLNDGFTARMITDGFVIRADDPIFTPPVADTVAEDQPKSKTLAPINVLPAPKP